MQNAPVTKEIERTSGSGYVWAAIGIVSRAGRASSWSCGRWGCWRSRLGVVLILARRAAACRAVHAAAE